ncbi:MAG: hypothetical protein QG662_2088, partial [Pseudomonadota bacterium]|nr:hypothetical protein [Pseudomonadota bacterium]
MSTETRISAGVQNWRMLMKRIGDGADSKKSGCRSKGESIPGSGDHPRRMESKNSLLFLVARILSSRNSIASMSSIGYS